MMWLCLLLVVFVLLVAAVVTFTRITLADRPGWGAVLKSATNVTGNKSLYL